MGAVKMGAAGELRCSCLILLIEYGNFYCTKGQNLKVRTGTVLSWGPRVRGELRRTRNRKFFWRGDFWIFAAGCACAGVGRCGNI